MKISLRAARINAGFTQAEAAKRLFIGVSTLQGYECGRHVPRLDIVNQMTEVYAIQIQNLKV